MTVLISAACRLHFGLLNVPAPEPLAHAPERDSSPRRFGGLGLMIDAPRIVVEARPAKDWRIEGTLAARARQFVDRIAPASPLFLTANGPPEHVGLGVGTALGMAIAEAVSVLNGQKNRTAHELAAICGRGERSGIGATGFRLGGFIVDAGKREGDAVSECHSIPFPADWRIVVARPNVVSKWSGEAERAAFARPRSTSESRETSRRLDQLMHESIVPALSRGDFATFAAAMTEYNVRAGEPFVADQGGVYSSPEVAKLIGVIQSFGLSAAGQSSWGPTVFAIVESEIAAESLVERINAANRGVEWDGVAVARPAGPARVEAIN